MLTIYVYELSRGKINGKSAEINIASLHSAFAQLFVLILVSQFVKVIFFYWLRLNEMVEPVPHRQSRLVFLYSLICTLLCNADLPLILDSSKGTSLCSSSSKIAAILFLLLCGNKLFSKYLILLSISILLALLTLLSSLAIVIPA